MTLRPSRAAQQPCLSLCHLRTYVLSALFSEVESDHLRENTRLCCPFSHPHGGDRMGSVSLFQLSMSKQGRHLCFHFYGPGLIWKPWLACALTGGGLDLEFPWMVMLPGKKFSLYLENFHLGPTYHSVPVDADFWFCPAAVRSYSLASWLFFFFQREQPSSSTSVYSRRASWLAAGFCLIGVLGWLVSYCHWKCFYSYPASTE